MGDNNQNRNQDKLSMGLSVFIALCVVSLFCAVSIAIVENIEPITTKNDNIKRVNLQNAREFTGQVF